MIFNSLYERYTYFFSFFYCYWQKHVILSSAVSPINHVHLINLFHLWLLLTPGISSISIKIVNVKVLGGFQKCLYSSMVITVFEESFHHIPFGLFFCFHWCCIMQKSDSGESLMWKPHCIYRIYLSCTWHIIECSTELVYVKYGL